jgi:hypothetical protein
VAKRRIGARLGSSATAGEGTQNLLCAYLAIAVFAGLAANMLWGAWWLDGVVALGVAGWAVVEGRRTWAGNRVAAHISQGHRADRSRLAILLIGADLNRARSQSGVARSAITQTRA